MLRYRMNQAKAGKVVTHSGGTLSLDAAVEEKLAKCIGKLCRMGFSPTANDICDLVADYLNENNITIAKFTDNRPGKSWLEGFMLRHNLSMKKAEMISLAQNLQQPTLSLFMTSTKHYRMP